MANDPLASLRSALDNVVQMSSLANRNLNDALQTLVGAVSNIDIAPPPPVLRIANNNLQEALDGQGIVFVPPGNRSIAVDQPPMVRDRTLLIFHADASLTMATNGLDRYSILWIDKASDVQILGGHLYGDRLTHDFSSGGTHEHGCGLRIGSSKRIYVRDLWVSHCTGDGVDLSGEDITVENITSELNRRQGMSIFQGRKYRVLGGRYASTTTIGTNAWTGPGSGIDIEPDRDSVDDVILDSVLIEANATAGLLLMSNAKANAPITNVMATDCRIIGNANSVDIGSQSGQSVELALYRNYLQGRKCNVLVEAGAKVKIGDSTDQTLKNTFVSIDKTGIPKSGVGKQTRYDIQTRGVAPNAGIADIGYNDYILPPV